MGPVLLCFVISHLLFGLGVALIEHAKVKGEIFPFNSKLEFFFAFTIVGYSLVLVYVAFYVASRKASE